MFVLTDPTAQYRPAGSAPASTAIDFDALRLRVVTALEPWPAAAGPATAGVNGFGFGGANAHVLLQEHSRPLPPVRDDAKTDAPDVLVLSAKSNPSLLALAR